MRYEHISSHVQKGLAFGRASSAVCCCWRLLRAGENTPHVLVHEPDISLHSSLWWDVDNI